jgi:hypothetical protein
LESAALAVRATGLLLAFLMKSMASAKRAILLKLELVRS